MNIKNIIGVASFLVLLGSCNDGFLERAPQNLNDQTFWTSVSDLEVYANNFYSTLPGGVNNLSDTDSDNQLPTNPNSFIWGQYSVPAEGGGWAKSNWSAIRSLNYFMTHYKTVQGSEADINHYVAEIRFFRALEYFSKIKTFGDVPWLEEDLNVNSEALYGPKMKRDKVAEKIIEDLDFAIQWLPDEIKNNRINKDVARHVKARVCLHEGTYYKYHTELGFTNEAKGLLEMAAKTSDELINSGKYEIYSTGHPKEDYQQLFVLNDKSSLKEAILYIDYEEDKRMHGMSGNAGEPYCGFSKDFVESILCDDGKPIGVSNRYQGDEGVRKESANRDPRYKQLILTYDFPTDTQNGEPIYNQKDEDFIDQSCYSGYKTIKGRIPNKQMSLYMRSFFDGIAYRYAETLLINAEAKAELGTITQADLDKTINKLRDRVAMPHLTLNVGFTDPNWPDWGYTLSPLLQEIRRERRVELAGEGFRFDDICRWKAGKILNNVKTYVGMKLKQADGTYRCTLVYPNYTNEDLHFEAGKSREWNDKLYLYPIPTGELQRNPQLEPQNSGW